MTISPEEIGASMLAALQEAIRGRNAIKANREQLYVTMQTDIPGKINIDIDFPTESMAIKNHYVCRLEINAETGEMALRSNGMTLPENADRYSVSKCGTVLQRMLQIVKTH